jgi:Flp pilus assembly protein protease CpaA
MRTKTIDMIGVFVLALVFFAFGLLGAALGTALQTLTGVSTAIAFLLSTTVTVALGWLLLDYIGSEL